MPPDAAHPDLIRDPQVIDAGLADDQLDAALDLARRLPEDTNDQGEALFRITRSQNSLLSLWSDFQAQKPGSGGP